jgi:hypothetical protein
MVENFPSGFRDNCGSCTLFPDSIFRRPAANSTAVSAVLFAIVTDPYLPVAVQVLDGITAATLGIMLPLTIADLPRGTVRFNLAQGVVGTAVGIGASISPTLAGYPDRSLRQPRCVPGAGRARCHGPRYSLVAMDETRPDRL